MVCCAGAELINLKIIKSMFSYKKNLSWLVYFNVSLICVFAESEKNLFY